MSPLATGLTVRNYSEAAPAVTGGSAGDPRTLTANVGSEAAAKGSQTVSPLALLLHAWRLRRVRRAFATLNRRLAAYEAAYGTGAFQMTDEEQCAAVVRQID